MDFKNQTTANTAAVFKKQWPEGLVKIVFISLGTLVLTSVHSKKKCRKVKEAKEKDSDRSDRSVGVPRRKH